VKSRHADELSHLKFGFPNMIVALQWVDAVLEEA